MLYPFTAGAFSRSNKNTDVRPTAIYNFVRLKCIKGESPGFERKFVKTTRFRDLIVKRLRFSRSSKIKSFTQLHDTNGSCARENRIPLGLQTYAPWGFVQDFKDKFNEGWWKLATRVINTNKDKGSLGNVGIRRFVSQIFKPATTTLRQVTM